MLSHVLHKPVFGTANEVWGTLKATECLFKCQWEKPTEGLHLYPFIYIP